MKIQSLKRVRVMLQIGGGRAPVIVVNTAEAAVLDDERSRAALSTEPNVPFAEFVWMLCKNAVEQCSQVKLCDCAQTH
jgi:hypothetical protein